MLFYREKKLISVPRAFKRKLTWVLKSMEKYLRRSSSRRQRTIYTGKITSTLNFRRKKRQTPFKFSCWSTNRKNAVALYLCNSEESNNQGSINGEKLTKPTAKKLPMPIKCILLSLSDIQHEH